MDRRESKFFILVQTPNNEFHRNLPNVNIRYSLCSTSYGNAYSVLHNFLKTPQATVLEFQGLCDEWYRE